MDDMALYRQRINGNLSSCTTVYGTPVYISSLNSGLYIIIGTWSIIEGDVERSVSTGDLFFVLNDAVKYRVMRVYSEGLEILECPVGGAVSAITVCDIAPKDFVTNIDNAASNLELPSALAVKTKIDGHTTTNATAATGVHGLRVDNGVLQYHNGTTWVTMSLDNFII
ncbi:MAG: hypothetical protein PHR82_06705 [Endomicrobiaceae bacterium]|nr:hypothetical protein [Endomicrobiaceae bacterium]